MSATDLILRLLSIFEQLHIQYMMVGSYSSNYYGRPRSTRDADFVLILSGEQFERLRRRSTQIFASTRSCRLRLSR